MEECGTPKSSPSEGIGLNPVGVRAFWGCGFGPGGGLCAGKTSLPLRAPGLWDAAAPHWKLARPARPRDPPRGGERRSPSRPARLRTAPGAEIQIWTAAWARVRHWRLRARGEKVRKRFPVPDSLFSPSDTLSRDSLLFFFWIWTAVSPSSRSRHPKPVAMDPFTEVRKLAGSAGLDPFGPPTLLSHLDVNLWAYWGGERVRRACAWRPRGPAGAAGSGPRFYADERLRAKFRVCPKRW